MRGRRLVVNPGDKYGRFTIINELPKMGGRRYFLCKCDCDNVKSVRLEALTSGNIVSCGCYNREISKKVNTKHGMYEKRLYRIWCGIKGRCFNPNNTAYHNYGGRGITICEEWLDFKNFYDWAIKNEYKDNLTIERIDVNGNYGPSNCTWATMTEQKQNTRKAKRIEFNGQAKTLRQWAKHYGIHSSTLCRRLKDGWDLEKALTAPAYSLHRRSVCK